MIKHILTKLSCLFFNNKQNDKSCRSERKITIADLDAAISDDYQEVQFYKFPESEEYKKSKWFEITQGSWFDGSYEAVFSKKEKDQMFANSPLALLNGFSEEIVGIVKNIDSIDIEYSMEKLRQVALERGIKAPRSKKDLIKLLLKDGWVGEKKEYRWTTTGVTYFESVASEYVKYCTGLLNGKSEKCKIENLDRMQLCGCMYCEKLILKEIRNMTSQNPSLRKYL